MEKIPLDYLHRELKNSIDNESCKKIIFSGKFGSGKTFYLQDFFEKDENKREYNCVHLFPVYYHIANNEDVLRLIETDIFIELLKKKIVEEEKIEPFGFILLLQNYIQNQFPVGSVFNNLVQAFFPVESMAEKAIQDIGIPEGIGKIILDLLKKPFVNDFKKMKVELQRDYNFEEIQKLVNENSSNLASSHGETIYQKMLYEILSKHKAEKGKRNILVIDDLDRVDPAHIFRILNVFSASLKAESDISNLLGFDKVILVCDEENLRSIYHHSYGDKADYNGYISKFKDKKIEFDPKRVFIKKAESIVKQLVRKLEENPDKTNPPTNFLLHDENHKIISGIISSILDGVEFEYKGKKCILKKTIRDLIKLKINLHDDDFKHIDLRFDSLPFFVLHVFFVKFLNDDELSIEKIIEYYHNIKFVNNNKLTSLFDFLKENGQNNIEESIKNIEIRKEKLFERHPYQPIT